MVVGFRAEARIAAGLTPHVVVGGGTPSGAEAAALAACGAGAIALISFGLAGGLDPALRPGMILVPDSVLVSGRRILADLQMSNVLGGPSPHALLAGNEIATSAAAKRRLFDETGAAAIDLESGAVARIATDRGMPFAILRAICDPAWRDLPEAALLALDGKGRIGARRVLESVMAAPGQIPGLLALARDAAAARAALRRRVGAIRL